jgi:LPS O-antigen subunit length determinant protein (WzzB/FepE family)
MGEVLKIRKLRTIKSEPKMKSNLSPNEKSCDPVRTLDFFEKSAKWIAVGIALGLSFSLIYLLLAQPKYEAHVSLNLGTLDNKLTKLTSNNFLMKMYDPSNYGIKVLETCSPELAFNDFIKNLKITLTQSDPIQMNLRYASPNPKEAVACLEVAIAVFKDIHTQEINTIMKSKEENIISLKENIIAIKSTIRSEGDSEILAVVNYLMKRDELNLYRSKIVDLKVDIDRIKGYLTSGASTAKISVETVGPKRKIVLLNGLFSGIIFGLLIQLLVSARQNLRNN